MSKRLELSSLTERIDAVLPQTQCRKCGHAGCRPYAEAIACGAADIDQCGPGGADCIADMAAILEVPVKALDPRFGGEPVLSLAVIDEARCIGCTLCIKACPVDAIAGAAKLMHTVIASACTGCELCIPPCPVDCIRMAPAQAGHADRRATAEEARLRFERRNRRLERHREEALARRVTARAALAQDKKKKETIASALARARARLEKGAA